MERNKTGLWGEIYASRYLRDNGYRIITANYRTRLGELDIVADDGKNVCFVEVKTRGTDPMLRPALAVDENKQQRLTAAALIFLKEYKTQLQPRFDVCEIILDENYRVTDLNYIENAYDAQ